MLLDAYLRDCLEEWCTSGGQLSVGSIVLLDDCALTITRCFRLLDGEGQWYIGQFRRRARQVLRGGDVEQAYGENDELPFFFHLIQPGSVLAPVAVDAFRLNQAIEALRAYSLVRRNPRGKTLSIHRLVQAVLQDILEETEKRLWAERAMLSTNSVFPDGEIGTWRQCERLLPQALAAAQAIERYQIIREAAGRLLHKTAFYLQARARYSEAEQLYQYARRVFEQYLGPEHPHVATLLNGLANLYYEQGRYAEAEQLYQYVRQVFEQHLRFEHPQIAYPLNSLADIYYGQGK